MSAKILTIKKSADFKFIQKNCKKYHSQTLILLESKPPQKYLTKKIFKPKIPQKNLQELQVIISEKPLEFCRFGITISKQIHKLSTTRNFFKRRIRNALKDGVTKYAKLHHDYVIIAKKQILDVDYKKIYNDLKFCLKKI